MYKLSHSILVLCLLEKRANTSITWCIWIKDMRGRKITVDLQPDTLFTINFSLMNIQFANRLQFDAILLCPVKIYKAPF